MGTTSLICDPNELRDLFLFEKLTDEQLAWLCKDGRVERFEPGLVFREGEPATCFYVLMEGEVRMTKISGARRSNSSAPIITGRIRARGPRTWAIRSTRTTARPSM